MNVNEFLEEFHNMVEDINKRPKLMKNLKQGDKIWYVYYSYRGNGRTKSSISVNQYEVAQLDQFYNSSFFIHVMRMVHKTCIFDSANPSNAGKVTNNVELDTLCQLFSEDMNKSTVFHNDSMYAHAFALSFNKEDAINKMKSYVENKAANAKKCFDEFLARETKKYKEVEDEYNNILNSIDNESNRG